jgi:hypothetical protein
MEESIEVDEEVEERFFEVTQLNVSWNDRDHLEL